MHRSTVLLLCCFMLILAITPATIAQDDATYEPGACPFAVPDGESVDCGTLFVPEDRNDPNSPEIALAVAIVRAENGAPLPDPIIYLEGGPGGSAISSLDSWFDSPYRQDRDVILIDQRGTGLSEPGLFCIPEEDSVDIFAETEQCRDDLLDRGINIDAYTSATNAADINALRVALGYDQVNLYGVSYGTRLALTVMRDFPDGIRSVVLDSPYPPAADAFNDDGANFAYALNTLAADCAADATCNAAFPQLETFFVDLVTDANAEPIVVDMGDGPQELTGGDLIEILYGYFYDTTIIPYLPAIIYDIADGSTDALIAWEDSLPTEDGTDADYGEDAYDDEYGYAYGPLEDLSDEEFDDLLMDVLDFDDVDDLYDYLDSLSDDDFFALMDEIEADLNGGDSAGDGGGMVDLADIGEADGMFQSVTCAEEVPFTSQDAQAALLANAPAVIREHFQDSLIESVEVCEIWGVPLSGPIEDEIVVSDIPTLILVGQYDVATPPRWATLAAEGLSNVTVAEFPGAGHALIDATPCSITISIGFMADPASPPNLTCLGEIGAPAFYVP